MQTRFYVVTDENGNERLIKAASPSRALQHAYPKLTARAATALDVGRLYEAGVKAEVATEPQA